MVTRVATHYGTMTWCRVPVEDPGRRAGPKVPDEERKGVQARAREYNGESLAQFDESACLAL